jgi:hypothetical protein
LQTLTLLRVVDTSGGAGLSKSNHSLALLLQFGGFIRLVMSTKT